MIPTPKEHEEMAAQIAIATLDTVKFEGTPEIMQTSANAWASSSWNLAAAFFLAAPDRSEGLSEEDLAQLQEREKAGVDLPEGKRRGRPRK